MKKIRFSDIIPVICGLGLTALPFVFEIKLGLFKYALIVLGALNLVYLLITVILRFKTVNKPAQSPKKSFREVKQNLLESDIAIRLGQTDKNNKVLKNVLLKRSENSTFEIDVLMLNTSGIFIIECKNMKGHITGDAKTDRYWKTTYENGTSNEFYNPVMQNTKHWEDLKGLLGKSGPCLYKNLVVLSDVCTYDIQNVPDYAAVLQSKNLEKTIGFRSGKSQGILSQKQVDNFYEILKGYANASGDAMERHIGRITKNIKAKNN